MLTTQGTHTHLHLLSKTTTIHNSNELIQSMLVSILAVKEKLQTENHELQTRCTVSHVHGFHSDLSQLHTHTHTCLSYFTVQLCSVICGFYLDYKLVCVFCAFLIMDE